MKAIKNTFFKLDDILFKLADIIVLISTIVLIMSVAIQVFFRYVLNNSPRWTTELACFMLIFMVFWGAAIAMRKKMHIELDITKFNFPQIIIKTFQFISTFFVYFFIVVLFYYGLLITIKNVYSLSEAMKIPYAFIYVNIPISSLLMGVGYTTTLLKRQGKSF